jgi:hypothetical protein
MQTWSVIIQEKATYETSVAKTGSRMNDGQTKSKLLVPFRKADRGPLKKKNADSIKEQSRQISKLQGV